MRSCHCSNVIGFLSPISSEKSVREFHVTEETKGCIQIELAVFLATIDEKVEWEDRFRVGGEVAWCYE